MLLAEFDFESSPLQFYKAPNGEPVITAASLIRALKGNANNAAAIAKANVRSKWLIEIPTPTGGRPTLCLFEPGAYQLAANPMFQTELAERFQDFLFEDVLPKLRESRGFIMPLSTDSEVAALVLNHKKERAELLAKIEVAEQRGFNNAANKIFDPRAITEPEKHLLRMVKCLVNAIQRDFEYEISSKPINVRKQGMHRILLSNSKETYDGLPLGALSINTIFELLTILNHTDAGDGKNLVRAFYTLEVHWHAKVHPTRVIEGEFDKAILETAKKMQRVELLYLDAIRQRKAPPRLESAVC